MRYNAVRLAYFTLIAFICLCAAVGCGGGRGDGVSLPETDLETNAGDPLAAAPVLPVDGYIDPAEILARRGSELTTQSRNGAETEAASGNTAAAETSLGFAPSGAATGAWAVYRFADLVDSDFPLRLEFTFNAAAGLPDECYLGLSNYTDECWDWTAVEVPTGDDSLQVPTDIDAVSPGGNLYAVVMVLGETAAVLDTVTLHLDSYYLPVPNGLGASAGTADGLIRLTWNDPAVTWPGLEYTGVLIERALDPAGSWEELTVVDPAQTEYDDEICAEQGIVPLAPVYYRLRTVLNEIHGSPGLAVSGWLAVPAVPLLMATDCLNERIKVTWEPVAAADTYLLEYRGINITPSDWTALPEVEAGPEPCFVHTVDYPEEMEIRSNYDYEYRVKASLNGTTSLEWSPVDQGLAFSSCGFEASDGTDTGQIMLSWRGYSLWDSYVVYYRNTEGGQPVDWTVLFEEPYSNTIELSHSLTEPVGLEAEYGTEYEYHLFAVKGGEMYPDYLEEDTGYRSIGDVTNLTASDNDPARIALAWDEAGGVEGYLLEYRNTDGGTPTGWTLLAEVDSATTAFDHTDSAPVGQEAVIDTHYEYRAKAVWSGQLSCNWSETAAGIRTFGDVTDFSASDGHYTDRTRLAWSPIAGADAYELEYRNLDGGTPEGWTALTEVDGATASFDHTETEPSGKGCTLLTHYDYRVRGRMGTEYSPGWAADGGYAGAGPGDWNMDGREPKHQRRSPYIGPETPELLWSVELDCYCCGSPSLGVDGTVYVCGSWDDLTAINSDGTIKWTYDDLSCAHDQTPFIADDGTVYVSGLDYDGDYGNGFYLDAINPDGTLKWMQYAGSGDGDHYANTASPLPIPDGAVVWSKSPYNSPNNGRLYMSNTDGTPRWAYSGYYSVIRTPAIAETGMVYATVSDFISYSPGNITRSYRLHAINSDGSQAWSATEVNTPTSPSIGDDGRIYVCLGDYEDTTMYCYQPDGSLAWSLLLPGTTLSGLAIGEDGCIYTGFLHDSDDDLYRMYAFNPDGSIRWTIDEPYAHNGNCSSPAIDGAGTIYVGYADGLHAINPDGTEKWVFETGSDVMYSPAIGGDGTVYFPVWNTVYAIGEV